MRPVHRVITTTAGLVALLDCGPDSGAPLALEARPAAVQAGGDLLPWSEPEWLGAAVNSPSRELFPHLTEDGLRLYFHSDRPDGLGGSDIYVTHRSRIGCPWQAPVNLGPPLNTSAGDGDLTLLPGGRVAFMGSSREGGFGQSDLFLTRRIGPADDERWEEPVNLGPAVNTAAHETAGAFVQGEDGGVLYFNRTMDIYAVPVSRDGQVRGDPWQVEELSLPGIADGSMGIRGDGREMIFWPGGAAGSRPGSVGLADLWVSTRLTPNDPWSEPHNLGPGVNSTSAEFTVGLSHDGRTLLFGSNRGGGLGLFDLWVSYRGSAPPVFSPEECE